MKIVLLAWLLIALGSLVHAARLEVQSIPGTTLRGNPLGDPAERRLAVFLPDGKPGGAPTLVIYLPGWGGSSEDAIAGGANGWQGGVVDALSKAATPVRIAVVDGRSRHGGSQFLNSTATGRYADYISEEILPFLLKQYGPSRCVIAGHSSGAYGALMLAMDHHTKFQAVVALSPDSDFDTTHRALVEQSDVRGVTARDLAEAMKPGGRPPGGVAGLVLGLCANYTPIADKPGHFEWLYDAGGKWRPAAWQRWLELDPLTVVRRRPDAFDAAQRIYMDGAEHDEFGANIGARKIAGVLKDRPVAVRFKETRGGHSDRMEERLREGLAWALGGER